MDDWSIFRSLIADQQRRTRLENDLVVDRASLEQEFVAATRFHEALDNDEPAESLAALAASLGPPVYAPLEVETLEQLRKDLHTHPISFTSLEPPQTAAMLARSFARVSRIAFRDDEERKFLFATDGRYRPHASVQEWASNQYLVLMGQFVLIDTWTLCHILAGLMVTAAQRLPEQAAPWEHPDFPDALLDTARTNRFLHHQFAYAMCAATEGERFRLNLLDIHSQAQRELIEEWSGELQAGALDFMVGHELAHVACGHTRLTCDTPESPWYASKSFKDVDPEIVEEYLTRHWPAHGKEIDADLYGLTYAAGEGATGAWDLRLMGAQLAANLIAFTDRARYWMKHNEDPVTVVGARQYGLLGLVDLALPMDTHPWGRTRATSLMSAVRYLYWDDFDEPELTRKSFLMRAVGDVFGTMGGQALQAVQWISREAGEYMATVLPDDRLITLHWRSDFVVGRDEPTTITSVASKFYGDLTSDLRDGVIVEDHYDRGPLGAMSAVDDADYLGSADGARIGDERRFREELAEFEARGDDTGIARISHSLAAHAHINGHYDQAERRYLQAMAAFDQLEDTANQALILQKLGVLSEDRGDHEEADRRYRESLEKFEHLDDDYGIGTTAYLLGELAETSADYGQAERCYRRAVECFERTSNQAKLAAACGKLAHLVQLLRKNEEAELLYRRTLALAEHLPDPNDIAACHHELGILAQQRGAYREANRRYKKSLRLNKRSANHSGIAGSYHQLGMLAFLKRKFGRAERHYRRALRIFYEVQNSAGVASSMSQLGNVCRASGRLEEAINLQLHALNIRVSIRHPAAGDNAVRLKDLRSDVGGKAFEDHVAKILDQASVRDLLAMLDRIDDAEGRSGTHA